MSSPTTNQITNSSQVSGVTLTDVLNALRVTVGDGSGDMVRAVYDTDNDGKVDVANVAESVPWAGITEKPTLFPAQPYTHEHLISEVTGLQSALDSKQPTLVSSENIKTINGNSILGVGNVDIANGVSDHGVLTGLADDDHTQYHNDARGDARYSLLGHTHTIANVTGLQTALDTATNFTQTGTGAALRTVSDKLKDTVSVKDFGAVGDNVTDDSSAFNNAIASGAKRIVIPKGTYFLNSTVTIANSGVQLSGDGPYASILRSAAPGAAISINTGLSGVKLNNFQLTRTAGTAIAGYDGIKFNTLTEQADVSNLLLSRHWVGLSLCATSFSFVKEIIALNNYSHGVLVANNASYSGLQWSFFKCLSQTNNGFGLLYSTASGTSGASVGDAQLFSTYANKLGGVKYEGTATSPINGIRWFGGFVGEDGNHGMWLDTYNVTNHKIEGLFAEIAGTAACGVDQSTAATGTGHGILVSANNGWVDIIGCEVVGNSYNGIDMSATRWSILSTIVRLNGANASGGNRNGIRGRAGSGTIVGCVSKAHASFGIFSDVDTISIISNDVRENTTGSIASAFGSFVNSVVIGNQGFTDNNILSNLYINGTKILGIRDTGWTAMTGTANESTAYATGTVTLVQLAERVKALQDALTTHGIIGA